MLERLAAHVARILPGSGRRCGRCAASTPSPRTATSSWTGCPATPVVVGLGAAHGFKFAPTLGRLLADLATGERDSVSPTFALDRPALTDPDHAAHWLV